MHAKYHITRRLGQGGMAEVFEGELAGELGFTRKIAIKRVLADAAADPLAAQRFLDEARIASRLHHANIVAVLDVGLLEGLPFQVLELVEGINASQLMQRVGGALPTDIALIIAAEVARALEHAHAAHDATGASLGIVHRDVKPSNVLLSWAGDVKLSDFGIALARDRESKTEAGAVAGTSGFMAPEQRTRSEVDGRADVFALGLALHALLTGASPLQDISVEMAVLDGGAVPIDPSVDGAVARVLAGALATDRLARPTSRQLADQLEALVSARVTRDRRSVLRDYLAPLGEVPVRRAGALDHLFGVEVIATRAPGGELARDELVHYALRQTQASTRSEAPTAVSKPARSGARIAIAAGAAVLAIAGVAVWHAQSEDAAAPSAALAAAPPVVRTPVSTPPPDAAVAIAEVPPVAAPTPEPTPPPVAPPHVIASRVPTKPPVSPAPTTPPPAAPPPADVGTGYLQVAGAGMIGARVVVDGTVRGYPPDKIALPRGHHHVVVVYPDGTQSAPRDVDITDLSTLANPVRPTW